MASRLPYFTYSLSDEDASACAAGLSGRCRQGAYARPCYPTFYGTDGRKWYGPAAIAHAKDLLLPVAAPVAADLSDDTSPVAAPIKVAATPPPVAADLPVEETSPVAADLPVEETSPVAAPIKVAATPPPVATDLPVEETPGAAAVADLPAAFLRRLQSEATLPGRFRWRMYVGVGEEEAFLMRLRQVRPEWRGVIQVVFCNPPQRGDCKKLPGGWDMSKDDVLKLLLWKAE